MNKQYYTPFLAFLTIVCFASVSPVAAQDDIQENIDDIMAGFEDEAPEDEILEDIVQGFEDPEPEDGTPLPLEDDILQGFEDKTDAEPAPKTLDLGQKTSWSLDGELMVTAVYNLSPDAEAPWRGFSMLRPELELTLKNKFTGKWQGQIGLRGFYDAVYGLRGREVYTSQVRDEYETELELKDTFIEGSLSENLDLKLGRQIVVWGTLDNLRVNDVLNPLDLRQPGLTDIDDLRLPVTMAKLDYYFGPWDLSAMVIPEVRFSRRPVFGSDFFTSPEPSPTEDVPTDGVDNMQYAAALTGVFSGWDMGIYAARIYGDQPYVKINSPDQMVRKHARIIMGGAAANLALGNWLFKAEAAGVDGLRYTLTPGETYTRLDLGLGVEYSGFNETTLSMEIANRHLFNFDDTLEPLPDNLREDQLQWRFRIVRELLHNTLTLNLLAGSFGDKLEDGTFERLDAEYDLTDNLSIRGGGILYQTGDEGRFQDVDDLDRIFVVFRYSF